MANQMTSMVDSNRERLASLVLRLNTAKESTWIQMGNLHEVMNEPEKALMSYENVLRYNPCNIRALVQIAGIYRSREQFSVAVDFYNHALRVDSKNGEIYGALGHCFLMMEDMPRAHAAYQYALNLLQNPKDPNLWYGIGILYERYNSLQHAEDAFVMVLRIDPDFEKSHEIYFRLGVIYKMQQKYDHSLECFRHILQSPPRPLTEADIQFQIGHVLELRKEFDQARECYEHVLQLNPTHSKVLQQLGWLYHQNSSFRNQDMAVMYLQRSIEADMTDGRSWYLLGRCYMALQRYPNAFEAYQQAIARDNRNPTFWCSIGVLYYQIQKYRDALDAYSRAIRLNPYLSEVWYDLGTLYETCNQLTDAMDAYQKAVELDPSNRHMQQRLIQIRAGLAASSSGNPAMPMGQNGGFLGLPPSSLLSDVSVHPDPRMDPLASPSKLPINDISHSASGSSSGASAMNFTSFTPVPSTKNGKQEAEESSASSNSSHMMDSAIDALSLLANASVGI